MKIIKEGVVPNPNYTGTCRNCKTEVEAEPNEVKTHYPDQRDPRETTTYTVNCPLCRHSINVVEIRRVMKGHK